METEKYESIVQRIINLQKLVEQGVGGEAENARIAIERIVAKYGLSLDEILADDKPEFHVWTVKNKRERSLFIQCLGVVVESWQPTTRELRNKIGADLTKLQFAELSAMFDFHRANMDHEWKAMSKNFFTAYVSKHDIYPITGRDENRSGGNSKLSREDILRIIAMQRGMEDKQYRKQLKA